TSFEWRMKTLARCRRRPGSDVKLDYALTWPPANGLIRNTLVAITPGEPSRAGRRRGKCRHHRGRIHGLIEIHDDLRRDSYILGVMGRGHAPDPRINWQRLRLGDKNLGR